jgi:hypothetical protein
VLAVQKTGIDHQAHRTTPARVDQHVCDGANPVPAID